MAVWKDRVEVVQASCPCSQIQKTIKMKSGETCICSIRWWQGSTNIVPRDTSNDTRTTLGGNWIVVVDVHGVAPATWLVRLLNRAPTMLVSGTTVKSYATRMHGPASCITCPVAGELFPKGLLQALWEYISWSAASKHFLTGIAFLTWLEPLRCSSA